MEGGIMTELENAFDDAWKNSKTPLDKMFGDNQSVKKQRHRLTGWNGVTFRCCICGQDDGWTVESEMVFVCEHEPITAGPHGIRQLDHVNLVNVMLIEEVGE